MPATATILSAFSRGSTASVCAVPMTCDTMTTSPLILLYFCTVVFGVVERILDDRLHGILAGDTALLGVVVLPEDVLAGGELVADDRRGAAQRRDDADLDGLAIEPGRLAQLPSPEPPSSRCRPSSQWCRPALPSWRRRPVPLSCPSTCYYCRKRRRAQPTARSAAVIEVLRVRLMMLSSLGF